MSPENILFWILFHFCGVLNEKKLFVSCGILIKTADILAYTTTWRCSMLPLTSSTHFLVVNTFNILEMKKTIFSLKFLFQISNNKRD